MTKRYAILQKKLQELEAQIATIDSFPPDIAVPDDLFRDCHQRLDFLRRFLAAEVASSPSKPRHLAHISRRLDHLEAHLAAAPSDADDVDGAGSACSCTESCRNDDGDAAGSEAGSEGLAMVDQYNGETASLMDGRDAEMFSDCLVAEIGEDEEGIGLSSGGNWRIVVVFGVMGFVFFAVLLCWFGYGNGRYYRRFENVKFLTPT